MSERISRLDAEWVALSAVRDLIRVAAKGDYDKATYNNALDLGGALYPQLLGPESSLLHRERESDTTREYRQRARLLSVRTKSEVKALDVLNRDIADLKDLVSLESDRGKVDQLKRRLGQMLVAQKELDDAAHSEHELIFRDAHSVQRDIPFLTAGKRHRDFQLPDGKVLRLRVFHPDKPEEISGADIIYERHDPALRVAAVVAVQYKIWGDKVLRLSEGRTTAQLNRLRHFICGNKLCSTPAISPPYRFPYCSAFLRPTDRLQKPDQRLLSTGEHIPVCHIEEHATEGSRGGRYLEYDRIRDVSLAGDIFEYLFNRGKIGSRMVTYDELEALYDDILSDLGVDNVAIHAQEI